MSQFTRLCLTFTIIVVSLMPATAVDYVPQETAKIDYVAFSSDGKRALAVSSDNPGTSIKAARDDNQLSLWDVSSGEILRFFYNTEKTFGMDFSKDGKSAAVVTDMGGGYNSRIILVWEDVSSRKEPKLIMGAIGYFSVAFSPDGGKLVCLTGRKTVAVIDIASGAQIAEYGDKKSEPNGVLFSPDGQKILIYFENGSIQLWDLAKTKRLTTYSGNTDRIFAAAFSADGTRVVSGGKDKTVRVWDVKSGSSLKILEGHESPIISVAFSENGGLILSASQTEAKVWNAKDGKLLRTFKGTGREIKAAAFSAKGDLALLSYGNLSLFDTATGAEKPFKPTKLIDFVAKEDADSLPRVSIQQSSAFGSEKAALSPDGKYALSSSRDNTIKLWDRESGVLIRTFSGHTAAVTDLSFAPDGKHALSVGEDHTIRIWDLRTGYDVRRMYHSEWLITYAACFTPDGMHVLTGMGGSFNTPSGTPNLYLWDLASGTLERTFSERTAAIASIAVSPDGALAATGGWTPLGSWENSNEIKIWDIVNGTWPKSFKGHSDRVYSVAFSPDGKTILSCSADKTIKLWDLASGKEIRTIAGHGDRVYSAAFSPDGKTIISSSADKTVRLWDNSTGAEIRRYSGPPEAIKTALFTPDGATVFSGAYGGRLLLWETASGRDLKLSGALARFPVVNSAAISPDGKSMLSGASVAYRADNRLQLWSLDFLKLAYTLKGHSEQVSSVAFSPVGGRAASASWDQSVKLWDTTTGSALSTLSGHGSVVTSVCFSPDGARILSGDSGSSGNIRQWDALSGKLLSAFTGHSSGVTALAYSKDGNFFASGSSDKTLSLWKGPGVRERSVTVDQVPNSLAISQNGRSVYYGPYVTADGYWSTDETKWRWLNFPYFIQINSIACDSSSTAKYDSGDDRLLFGTREGDVILWDCTVAPYKLKVFKGHAGAVYSVAFSSDGAFAISSSADGSVRLWNLKNDEWVAFIANCNADNQQWMVIDNEGYWDSSGRGGELVTVARGLDFWSVDQFAVKNNRPDKILQKIPFADPLLIEHYKNQYLKRLKRLGFVDKNGSPDESLIVADYRVPEARIAGATQQGKYLELLFTLYDADYRVKRYNVFVNDVPLFGSYGRSVDASTAPGAKLELRERIELTPGANKIEISCMNERGAESYRALTSASYAPPSPAKPDLYYIGFGVSKYKDSKLNLKYADKDAIDLGAVFGKMKGQFANVYAKVYANEQCTVENMGNAKALLKNAKPDDTFVLFIAGHGIHDTDRDATYYYVTYETNIENLAGTAAAFETIEDLLQGVAPRNKLFLMDTCESGEVDEEVQSGYFAMASNRGIRSRAIGSERGLSVVVKNQTGPSAKRVWLLEKDRFIYNDLIRRSGAVVFSSCRGGEFSYESEEVGNGFFTYQVINALKGKAASVDGTVGIDSLKEYVTREVPLLADGKQNPTVDRDNIYQKFGFPVVK